MTTTDKTPDSALIYDKDAAERISSPRTAKAVLRAVEELTNALRAGKWPQTLISAGALKDRSGELIPAARWRFVLEIEQINVLRIYRGNYLVADCKAQRCDGTSARAVFLFRFENRKIKLVAVPIIG